SCRLNGVYETRGFAVPNRCIVGVAFGKGLLIAWPLNSDATLELFFSTMPALSECVAANPGRESGWPGELSDEVGHPRTQRAIAIRCEDGCMMALLYQSFFRCP